MVRELPYQTEVSTLYPACKCISYIMRELPQTYCLVTLLYILASNSKGTALLNIVKVVIVHHKSIYSCKSILHLNQS